MKRLISLLKKIRRWLIQVGIDTVRQIGRISVRWGAPVGTYAMLDQPRAISMILDRQESVPATPGSLRDICGFRQDKEQPFPIFWVHLPHARLVGKSLAVLNEEKEAMLESLYGYQYVTDPSFNYLHLPPAIKLHGNWTNVMGRWCNSSKSTFYHWMFDAVPRLALLGRFPSDTRIMIPAHLFPAQTELLEMLGVADRCRPTPEHHVLVENYYYSSFTSRQGCDNPYAIQFLREKFLHAAAEVAAVSGKIYIARRGGNRTPLQEEAMIAFLEQEGWSIVQAERLSLREQIGIFRQARAVCAPHGAALTNLVWCSPGCKVLEICSASYLNGCYESIALNMGLDYRFLVFPADSKQQAKVDMTSFKAAIHALA